MEIPRHWRLKKQRYLLEGSKCLCCGTLHFPPRELCDAPRNGNGYDPALTELSEVEKPAGELEGDDHSIRPEEVYAVAVAASV